MKKFLLSCMALTAGITMSMAQDTSELAFPESFDITVVNDKGLELWQGDEWGCYTVKLKGSTAEDNVTMIFDVPEGWDGYVNWVTGEGVEVGQSGINPLKAQKVDGPWTSLDKLIENGGKLGNKLTFTPTGKQEDVNMRLYKGDQVLDICIYVEVTIEKSEGGEEPGEPKFPESFIVNTFNEGLEVSQYEDWGTWTIKVEGEVSDDTFPIVIDVPEGFDGFVSGSWSEDEVVVTENNPSPRRTRGEEAEWITFDELKAQSYCPSEFVKGNRFTFKPTYIAEYNNYQTVEVYLYKGDMVLNEYFNIEVYVSKGESEEPTVPVFPETLDVAVDNTAVKVWQGAADEIPEGTLTEEESEFLLYMYPQSAIVLTGATSEDSSELSFNLPKGWTGVLPLKIKTTGMDEEGMYKTRSNESDWQMLDEVKANYGMMGIFDTSIPEGRKIDFTMAEKQIYVCYLYTDLELYGETYSMVDIANAFLVIVDPKGEAPAFPESFGVKVDPANLSVTQGMDVDYGTYDITIEGETSESQVTVTFAIPEGWDNFIGTTDQGYTPEIEPLKTRAGEDEEENWFPVEALEMYGYTQGNKLTFDIDGEEHFGLLFLVKDGMAYAQQIYIYMNAMPQIPDVEFPSNFDVKLSAEGPEATVEKGYFWEISVNGECTEDEITVTVDVPEGFDGIISDYNKEVDDAEYDWEQTWQPLAALTEAGYVEGNTFTFPTDGEKHYTMLFLYKGNYFNTEIIDLYVTVSKKGGSGVDSVEAAGNVRYYDLQGREISKPGKGAYIKVEGQKATKSIVK